MSDSTSLRPMSAAEVERLVEWAAGEGWNPGVDDARAFYAADPDGYLAVELNGEMVGGGGIVRHHPDFGFMGLFIVRPDHRGRGLGRTLWYARRDRLALRLSRTGTIGLDAIEAMREFYARGGFREATRHIRYQCMEPPPAADESFEAIAANSLPEATLAEFDRACFPSPRAAYLRAWIAQPNSRSFASVQDGALRGYAVMRRCRVGWKIGPLFAEDRRCATRLFKKCWETSEGAPVFLDVPEANQHGIALAEEFGMKPVFGCMRMYRGPAPELRMERIFGVTTLELG